MPTIDEFINDCAIGGIEHIEVVPDSELNDIDKYTSADEVLKVEQISSSVFRKFYDELMKSNVAFFLKGVGGINVILKGKLIDNILNSMNKEEAKKFLQDLSDGEVQLEPDGEGVVTIPISNDLFVENAIMLVDANGNSNSDNTLDVVSNDIEIPLNGGMRVYSTESVRDEIVACQVLCISANSLALKDGDKYKEDSLYGKLEKKIQVLKGDKPTIEGIKIPWLYTAIVPMNDSGDGGKCSHQIPYSSTSFSSSDGYFYFNYINLHDQALVEEKNYYYYKCYADNKKISDILTNQVKTNNAFIKTRSSSYSTFSSSLFYQNWAFGGYTNIHKDSTELDSYASYNKAAPQLDVVFEELPYIIGLVVWVEKVVPNGEKANYIEGFMTPVAFDKNGKIIEPLDPGEEDWDWQQRSDNAEPLKGKMLAGIVLEMSPAEVEYYLTQTTKIVPKSWLSEAIGE